jgi:tetratricopeptide (TPR) repeat protein
VRTLAAWIASFALAGATACAEPASDEPSGPAPHTYRYRFEPVASAGDDDTIAVLEARTSANNASPYDTAELAELYLARALRSADPADYARSETMARRSLAVLPYPNAAPLVLAKLANARHEFRAAIQIARDYLKRSNAPAAWSVLATAHLALGELAEASAAAERLARARPDSSAYLTRALVLQAQGRDAEADFERAVALEEPGDVEGAARTRALWARFLLRRGAYAAADAVAAEALRIDPTASLALAQRAEVALRTGKLADARARFERAFAESRQVRYLIDQARAQELDGDLEAATSTRAQVERLVRADLQTTGLGHRLELVEVLLDRGALTDVAEAIPLARAEVAARPSAETRFQLARGLARTGAHADALVELRAAIATGVRDARIFELAARLERCAGNAPRARLYAHEAGALDPGDPGWRGLGLIP